MSKRKTFDVRELIETVNSRNRASTCDPKVREGWNSLLENVLFACGVYKGFSYLSASEVPAGQPAGIIPVDSGFCFPDESRRCYHMHRSLTGEKLTKIGPHVYVSDGPRLPRDPMGAHGTLPSGDTI